MDFRLIIVRCLARFVGYSCRWARYFLLHSLAWLLSAGAHIVMKALTTDHTPTFSTLESES
jgi:hypothetical protein